MKNTKFEVPYFMRTDDEIRGFFLQYAVEADRDYIRRDAPIEALRDVAMDYEMPKPKSVIYYDYDEKGGYVAVIGWFFGWVVESEFISRTEFDLYHNATSDAIQSDDFKLCVIDWARQMRNEFDAVRVEYRPYLQRDFELDA